MNFKYALLAMSFAFGIGLGMNANAVNTSMHACCEARQILCEDAWGPARCVGVYERCMQGNNCNTQPW